MIHILMGFALLTQGDVSCENSKTTFKCVTYIRNYDGDTITFNFQGTHPLFGHEISVRVSGIDTPEIKSKDICERDRALQAKNVVSKILSKAKRIDVTNVTRGKYFRIIGDVIVDGHSIKDTLLKRGLATEYSGGKKTETDWCKRGVASK